MERKFLFQQVLDQLPFRVFIKNQDYQFIGCNQAFAEDSGCKKPEELLGKTDFDFWPAD